MSEPISAVVRADSGTRLGAGHVMRCLVIAREIVALGGRVEFVCRELPGNFIAQLRAEGHTVSTLGALPGGDLPRGERLGVPWNQDAADTRMVLERNRADWLIVDHYGISAPWETALRPYVGGIMVIDDLADRPHDCDLIFDQNFYDDLEQRYERWVPPHADRLLGPRYALLRREFLEARPRLRARDGNVGRILVAFGGSDSSNETAKVLEALGGAAFGHIDVDVVLGGMYVYKDMLRRTYGANLRIQFHENAPDLSILMAAADLSIGAGGTMNWERCYLGLPAVVIVIAENQSETSAALHRAAIVENLGWHARVTVADIAAAVARLAANAARLQVMSRNAMQMMPTPGSPSAQRTILDILTERKFCDR
jgi:UDP-2,4-diacetamido-2,4,6-trideoxy-beta-L-altropyranose hydrolase